MQTLLEELKVEHRTAIERGDERDAIQVQVMTLEIFAGSAK